MPKRRSKARAWPPIAPCHTLVTNDGMTSRGNAASIPKAAERSAMATVGSPRPTTPFTPPASRNTSITVVMESASTAVPPHPSGHRRPSDAGRTEARGKSASGA